jgi:hypothetical protein
VKRKKKHANRHYIPGRHEDAAVVAERLAPAEEKGQRAAPAPEGEPGKNGGSIVVDTGALKLPAGFGKDAGTRRRLGLEPVVIVIVALMLAFIAFVAWQITKMPIAADDPPPHTIRQGGPSPTPGN